MEKTVLRGPESDWERSGSHCEVGVDIQERTTDFMAYVVEKSQS